MFLELAGHACHGGDQDDIVGDWRIEVIDLDGRRIDKLLVQRTSTG